MILSGALFLDGTDGCTLKVKKSGEDILLPRMVCVVCRKELENRISPAVIQSAIAVDTRHHIGITCECGANIFIKLTHKELGDMMLKML